jgi:DNA-binding GntR family transcriptional regulator
VIDRDSDVPPYRQIADRLREQIRAGELAPRSRLPSIERLVQEEGVARLTARKALAVLVDEGYARRRARRRCAAQFRWIVVGSQSS